jgi:ribosomal protein S18 acetylase RimI-like enzyme
MITIEALDASSGSRLLESARELFRAYGEFLRTEGGHCWFNYEKLQQEILDMPLSYTLKNGGVLVALNGDVAIGCIAFREMADCVEPGRCEIKRLFVMPGNRGLGAGWRLASAALEYARAKGYREAYLDTAPSTMWAAYQTYLKLGFKEYERRGEGEAAISFMRKSLLEGAAA